VSELHLPWLEAAIAIPALGSLWVARLRDPIAARRYSLAVAGLALACALGAYVDFALLHVSVAHAPWDVLGPVFGGELFAIDELSGPLIPLVGLLYLLTFAATLRTKVRRFSFAWSLAREAVVLAAFSCRQPWVIVGLLVLGTIQPFVELRSRRKPTRVYLLHMGAFAGLLIAGQALIEFGGSAGVWTTGLVLLTAAVLLRSGIVPVHTWMTDLFEHAAFGTALLFVTPMVGAYAAVRLVLPIAPDWMLQAIAFVSLATAVYAAGMALVQREARRFFAYLFLSHSSLVLVGVEIATPLGLTGALCVWLAVGLSLAGFGLTLRSVEARTGRLSLNEFHGLYPHTPMLAAFFLLTGLASIGFPGTVGFVGVELLVESAVQVSPAVGAAVVLAAALNSLAVLHAYFRVFTGTRHESSINLRSRLPERIAVLALTILILGGGLYPQPGVSSRHRAAEELVELRERALVAAERSGRPPSLVALRREGAPTSVPRRKLQPNDFHARRLRAVHYKNTHSPFSDRRRHP
jgi:NADH-quinone oxidoreductase subunit M